HRRDRAGVDQGVIFRTLSSLPFDVVTYNAPSGPVRAARRRPYLSWNCGGIVTDSTLLPASFSLSSNSFAPFSAVLTGVPSTGPHGLPVRNAAPQIASVVAPDSHSARWASGNRFRSVIGVFSS